MSNSTTTKSRPTGFFDLALELRQQIYRECLPLNLWNGSIVDVNHRDRERFDQLLCDSEQDLRSLREADPRIAPELDDEERICCDVLCFNVTANNKWEPPPPKTYPNLSLLSITYSQYHLAVPLHHIECTWCFVDREIWTDREKSLATMFWNLRRFVAWFNEANSGPLKALALDFQRPTYDLKILDPRWCTLHYNWDRKIIGASLATREANGKTVSLVESVLMPLMTLPVVKDVSIDFGSISTDDELALMGRETRFDEGYMTQLESTWKQWLGGKRDIGWRKQFQRNLERYSRRSRYGSWRS